MSDPILEESCRGEYIVYGVMRSQLCRDTFESDELFRQLRGKVVEPMHVLKSKPAINEEEQALSVQVVNLDSSNFIRQKLDASLLNSM